MAMLPWVKSLLMQHRMQDVQRLNFKILKQMKYIFKEKAGKYKLLDKILRYMIYIKPWKSSWISCLSLRIMLKIRVYIFFSPYGKNALKILLDLDCDLIKISSYEISNLPWIREVARTKKPIILSCGGAKLEEVDRALGEIYGTIIKLH